MEVDARRQTVTFEQTVVDAATRKIVEHILVLSFGERFRVEMRDFVRIFYEYKQAGLIK